ncbi:hypothetical protein GYMLUDRAFT_64179 [Collybiopsis luxurians FD-317 M1]|uniref:Uncharacterized protein n=1 Tax=Collybiopsis luxurians FD-317 M1 TaxID=944289 RepID=A0A0D0AQG5_9AGAR|nr:hypothetical protein GYMLUDRAFT_64179 [Collybiopsis luxurians FD-317 M1]
MGHSYRHLMNSGSQESTFESSSSSVSASGWDTSTSSSWGNNSGNNSGWGNESSGWGSTSKWGNGGGWGNSGWGHRSPSPQPPPGGLVAHSPLNNLRSNFNSAGLTWDGTSSRPTHLDNHNTRLWAELQLNACSERGLENPFDLPTFMGLQVEQRIAQLLLDIAAKESEQEAAESKATIMHTALNLAQAREDVVREELRELRETKRWLADLLIIARACLPPTS